jgi:hypothetical protein
MAFTPPDGQTYYKMLVAAANNNFYFTATDRDGFLGVLWGIEFGAEPYSFLDTSNPVSIFAGFQKCYIANEAILKVVDFDNIKITTTDLGASIHRGNILTGGTSGAMMSVDYITSDSINEASVIYGHGLNVNIFDTEVVTGTNNDGDAISFTCGTQTKPEPHSYDWTVFGGNTDTYGSLPDKATIGCLYRGRAVLSGNEDYPFQWYMSRQANLYDWNYASGDSQSAVAGGNADAGEIGDVVTALIPYKDDYLIFGCADSIWALRGDPAAGGSLNEISLTTGIYGPTSWCWDANDNMYFLGSGGIYVMPPPFGIPENISSTRLPRLLIDWELNPKIYRVSMAYDRDRHGLFICRTKLSDGINKNLWFDLRTKGFFPETYPALASGYSLYYFESTLKDYRGLMVGCKDGYIRCFKDDKKSDDTDDGDVAIDSYVVFGPKLIAPSTEQYGKLISFSVTTSENTGNFYYKIFVDNKAEGIITQLAASPLAPAIAGTTTVSPRPIKLCQKAKGTYLALKVGNDTLDKTWSMEVITGQIKKAGNR